ncbi:vitamin K epoxide reductase complex subunit 1-like protein 1 [Atheta coriaria]|uniref:vitamin K epoxide reductase complex subunit 1-like protein 1 n=1 Tax=Dalotia coriaria TaxID=877792 RepID=UPI0031F3CFF3
MAFAVGVINFLLTFSCFCGLALSIYAYTVELQASVNENYEAMCDISEHMSCSKVFTSQYGKGFGFIGKLLGEKSPLNVPNSLVGIMAYSLLATLAQSNSLFITKMSYVLVLVSNLFSLYFAYILYFVLYDFCVVCVSTYVVNFLNMCLTLLKLKKLDKAAKVDSKKKRK